VGIWQIKSGDERSPTHESHELNRSLLFSTVLTGEPAGAGGAAQAIRPSSPAQKRPPGPVNAQRTGWASAVQLPPVPSFQLRRESPPTSQRGHPSTWSSRGELGAPCGGLRQHAYVSLRTGCRSTAASKTAKVQSPAVWVCGDVAAVSRAILAGPSLHRRQRTLKAGFARWFVRSHAKRDVLLALPRRERIASWAPVHDSDLASSLASRSGGVGTEGRSCCGEMLGSGGELREAGDCGRERIRTRQPHTCQLDRAGGGGWAAGGLWPRALKPKRRGANSRRGRAGARAHRGEWRPPPSPSASPPPTSAAPTFGAARR
jgi:hypothetical protein